MSRSTLSRVCLGLILWSSAALAAETIYHSPVPAGGNSAAVAAPRDDWYATVQGKFDRYGGRHADIVFDGDSITNRWETTGRAIWDQRYAKIAADFGIEGDRVENVLWRLSRGQVDGIDPKVVVLMIGTNNSSRNSAEQIADGIKAVVAEYLRRCPNAHVILMGVFPRGATADDGGRQKVMAVNALIAPLANDSRVSYIDLTRKLIESDGAISPTMMPDYVHPTERGYRIWSDAIQPLIDKYTAPASNAANTIAVASVSSAQGPMAVLTFSGLHNGVDSDNDPEVGQGAIPSSYQPLLRLFANTTPADGGNLGVTITWTGCSTSSPASNPSVKDHTGDYKDDRHQLGGGVMFGTKPFSMVFSRRVEIPSFFWTRYSKSSGEDVVGTICAYTNANDTAPARSIAIHYNESVGYVWKKETGLAGLRVAKITFDPGRGGALNIDDMMVRP